MQTDAIGTRGDVPYKDMGIERDSGMDRGDERLPVYDDMHSNR
jgi:hypothetical protein